LKNLFVCLILGLTGLNVFSQAQFEANIISEHLGGSARKSTSIDFDKDGDVDIITFTMEGNFIFYENDGLGNFTPKKFNFQNIERPNSTADFQVLDMDNDQDYDLVTATNRGVFWVENIGNFQFKYHEIYVTDNFNGFEVLPSIAVKDIDNDSDYDIAFASMQNDYYALLINNGNQIFNQKIISNDEDIANGANFVLLEDLDMDGDLDLVGASKNNNLYLWFENKGNLDFTPHIITKEYKYTHNARWIDIGDADNDGDLDLVATSPEIDRVFWLRNDGNQNFEILDVENDIYITQDSYMVKFHDKDDDGDLDVLSVSNHFSSQGYYWFENDASNEVNPFPDNHAADADVTLIHRGEYSFYPVFADVADLNGDGNEDVYGLERFSIAWFSNEDGSEENYKNQYVSRDAAANEANSIEAGDIDGDGDIDFVGASDFGIYSWFENIGLNNYNVHIIDNSGTANGSKSIRLVDLDGDGDLDFVAASNDSPPPNSSATYRGSFRWYENNGSGDFTTHTINDSSTFARYANYITVSDFDNDGDFDMVGTLDTQINSIVFFENDGLQNFTPKLLFENLEVSTGAKFISVEDINNDGKNDILLSGRSGNFYLLENQGAGDFSFKLLPQTTDITGGNKNKIKSGDINGDGEKDILVLSLSPNSYDVNIGFYRKSNNNFEDYLKIIELPKLTSDFELVDIDNDQDLDIFIAYKEGVYQLINDGSGNFEKFPTEEIGKGKFAVYVSHYEENGSVNLITATNSNLEQTYDPSDDGSSFIQYINKGTYEVPLEITKISVLPNDCENPDKAKVKIDTKGGKEPILFSLLNENMEILEISSIAEFGNLVPGNYFVQVEDKEENRVTSEQIEVSTVSLLDFELSITNVSCNGEKNGIADLKIEGGVTPYTITINDEVTSKRQFFDLDTGTYTVTIEDNIGCSTSKTFEISEPDVLSAEVISTTTTCIGLSDGEINITATGGTSPYEYKLNDQSYAGSNVFPDLAAGEYEVWIKDANDCSFSQTITVSESEGNDLDGDGIGDDCDDDIDGDGVLNADDTCNDTSVGEPVDSEGCSIFTLPTSNFTITSTSETCRASNNGKIVIAAEAENEYTASLSGNDINQSNEFTNETVFSNLENGNYQLCITIEEQPEYKQCFTIEIFEPEPLEVNSSVNMANRSVYLELKGSQEYVIKVNDLVYRTTENEIELNLTEERNTISVSTALDCQGIFNEQILLGSELVLYPNPVINGELTIKLPNSNTNAPIEVTVYSDNGMQVLSKQVRSQEGKFSLYMDGMVPGVYTLRINSEERSYYSRVIKK